MLRCFGDGLSSNAEVLEKYSWRTRAGNLANGKRLDDYVALIGKGRSDSFTNTAFGIVILNCQYATLATGGLLDQKFSINGLDGERIQDGSLDSGFHQDVRGFKTLMKGDTSTNNKQIIFVVASDDVSFSNFESKFVVVENGGVGTGSSDEADAFGLGSDFNSAFTANGVTGIENGASCKLIKNLAMCSQ